VEGDRHGIAERMVRKPDTQVLEMARFDVPRVGDGTGK
jgi:hypothetical protein